MTPALRNKFSARIGHNSADNMVEPAKFLGIFLWGIPKLGPAFVSPLFKTCKVKSVKLWTKDLNVVFVHKITPHITCQHTTNSVKLL